MGLKRWLKKRGSTGSIARWVAENMIKLTRDGLSEDEAIRRIIRARYVQTPVPLEGSALQLLHERTKSGHIPTNSRELARFIWDLEIGIELPPELWDHEMHECYEILDEELINKGIKLNKDDQNISTKQKNDSHIKSTDPQLRNNIKVISSCIRHADHLTCQLWTQSLGHDEMHYQARHGVAVIVAAIASLGSTCLSIDALIDLAAVHLDDIEFEAFLQNSDVREGLTKLFKDTQSAVQAEDLVKISELLQTFLLMPVQRIDTLSSSEGQKVVQCSTTIFNDTMAASKQ
jgi:hypothetical protein